MLKNTFFLAAVVALPLAAGACSHDKDRVTKSDVNREQAEAKATTEAYVDQKVDDMKVAVREKCDKIDTKISSLRMAAKNESPAVQANIQESINRLEAKKARIRDRSKELEALGKSEAAEVRDEWVRLGTELDEVTAALDNVQHDIKKTN
jgi:hypothetical protein